MPAGPPSLASAHTAPAPARVPPGGLAPAGEVSASSQARPDPVGVSASSQARPAAPPPPAGTGSTAPQLPGRAARTSWYLYDLANQMFPFIVISFVFNPWIVETLGGRDWMYMVAFATSMLVALLLAPIVGAATDRIGRRPVLIAASLVAITAIALLGVGELLGLPRVGTLVVALLFFAAANLGFQLGVVAYDAFLPAVSHRARLGITGGLGIAAGYLGSLVALALMFLVTGVLGLGEPILFVFAALLFLLLALPAFVFLRDAPAALGEPLGALVRASLRSALGAVRGIRRDKVLARFLVTRFFYADAVNTMILVMGVYAIAEVGFVRESAAYTLLLGTGVVFAILAAPLWGLLVDRIGPRHTLVFVLMGWCLVFLVVAIHPVLGLPRALFYLVAACVGVLLAGTWTSDRPLLVGVAPPERVGEWFGLYALAGRFAAITGPLTWALLVDVLFRDHPGARQFGILSLLATMLLALFLLRRLPDPFQKGAGPLARVAPWGDGSGRRAKDALRRLVSAPFVLLYLAVSWLLFFAMDPRRMEGNILVVDVARLEGYPIVDKLYFWLPDLLEAPWRILPALVTAPMVNVHLVQLAYVTVLLLLFGVVFEAREGTRRFLLVFFGASAVGALFASVLHAILYPGLIDHPILESARNLYWTGGSAGAFGVAGAVAARARNPWPLLLFLLFWEVNVGLWWLRSYTPAFHLSALAAGFLAARFWLRVPGPVGRWPRGPAPPDAQT